MKLSRLTHLLRLPLAGLLLPVAALATDAIKTWDAGGNGNFANGPNWDGTTANPNGVAPTWGPLTDTDRLLFAGLGSGASINLNVTDATVKSWTFTAGTYTFTGAQNVTLGDTTTKVTNTGLLTNNSTGNTITFNNSSVIGFRFGGIFANSGPFVFGSNATVNVGLGLNAATNNVTIATTFPVTVGGPLIGAGTHTSAGGALIKTGASTLILNGTSSQWAGRLNITDGAVRISKATSLGSDAGRTTISGDASTARLEITGNIGLTEPLYLGGHASGNAADHIRNISGNNLLLGPIALDAGGSEYAFQSDAGLLTITSNLNYGTQTGTTSLRLLGSGNGLISGAIGVGGAALGITKEGSGTWTLSGANGYTGPINITAGRLDVTTAQTGTGAATLADGVTLGLTLAASGQTFSPSALTLGSTTGSTIALDLGSFGTNPTLPVINTGALNVNGTTTINLKAGGLSVGQFPLIGYTSVTGSGVAGLGLGTLPARVSAALVDDSAHPRVNLNVTVFDYPRWTGNVDGTWDTDDGTGIGTSNWREFNSGLITRYLQGAGGTDGVLFDDTAAGPTSVNLSTTLSPSFARVNNDAATYTFSGIGKLSGAATLTREGPGRLIIVNPGINDFTGVTTINGGSLEIGDGAQAGGGSTWFLTLMEKAAEPTGQRPKNFITLQIDPVTGRLRTFQPS